MYKFYHVDMGARLRQGMTIELSEQTTSVFGDVYWKQFRHVGIKQFPSQQIAPPQTNLLGNAAYREFWLEFFRMGHPELKCLELPSRLNSFFVVESIEDAHRYITRSNLGKNLPIFEVHSQEPGAKFDMTWLDQQFPRDYQQFGYYYLRYWKGLRMDEDHYLAAHEIRGSLMEVLLSSTITIGQRVT